jgi:hypothetical protein
VRPHDRPYIQASRERRLARVQITMNNERRHLGSVLAARNGINSVKSFRIVNVEPTLLPPV